MTRSAVDSATAEKTSKKRKSLHEPSAYLVDGVQSDTKYPRTYDNYFLTNCNSAVQSTDFDDEPPSFQLNSERKSEHDASSLNLCEYPASDDPCLNSRTLSPVTFKGEVDYANDQNSIPTFLGNNGLNNDFDPYADISDADLAIVSDIDSSSAGCRASMYEMQAADIAFTSPECFFENECHLLDTNSLKSSTEDQEQTLFTEPTNCRTTDQAHPNDEYRCLSDLDDDDLFDMFVQHDNLIDHDESDANNYLSIPTQPLLTGLQNRSLSSKSNDCEWLDLKNGKDADHPICDGLIPLAGNANGMIDIQELFSDATVEETSRLEPQDVPGLRACILEEADAAQTPRRSAYDSTSIITPANIDDIHRKPMTRPPFPSRARDRSPILGLIPNTVLRTCFRTGEAINVGCNAVRNGEDVILELYARVTASNRDMKTSKQNFVFADLYHNRSPLLHGFSDLWKSDSLYDYDSSGFLEAEGDGRLCRCIGRMTRNANGWILKVMNIFDVCWDDVDYVAGIICT